MCLFMQYETHLSVGYLEPDESEEDPKRLDSATGIRRLAVAILIQALIDFREARDRRHREDAKAFLFPKDPGRAQLFRETVECSAVDRFWLREKLMRMQERTPESLSRRCKNCGLLPLSEFRNGQCKKCLREKACRLRRRSAG
jgi:hypothetical protein